MHRAIIAFLVLAPAFKPDWVSYSDAEAGYSIDLPGRKYRVSPMGTLPSKWGNIRTKSVNLHLSIPTFCEVTLWEGSDGEQLWREFIRKNAVLQLDKFEERPITTGPLKGTEITYSKRIGNEQQTVIVRSYVVGKRVYVVLFSETDGERQPAVRERFFGSFKVRQ